MSDLKSLLERVEKATGPDRELDVDILQCLISARTQPGYHSWQAMRPRGAPLASEREFWRRSSRHRPLSSSIDDALALVNEKLPGAEYTLSNLYGIAYAEFPLNAANSEHLCSARREDGNMPLCIVECLLRALIAQQEAKEGTDGR